MTAAMPLARPDDQGASPFAGADVCRLAGLRLLPGRRGPAFGDDVWDFTAVAGLPAQMQPSYRRWDFTAITIPAWQLVAREQLMALLAPRHEAVAALARASRTPLHLRTCQLRFAELVRLLNGCRPSRCGPWASSPPSTARHTWSTAGRSAAPTGTWPASAVPLPCCAPPAPSPGWSATASCSPPTGLPLACGPSAAPPQRAPRS